MMRDLRLRGDHEQPTRRLSTLWALVFVPAMCVFPAQEAAGQKLFTGGYVTATSDYDFRGITQTQNDPALQVGLDFAWKEFGFSLWSTNVDFGSGSTADIETDLGLSWGRALNQSVNIALAAIHYLYSGESSLDYSEFSVSLEIANSTVGFYLAPDYSGTDGDAIYLDLGHSIALPKEIELGLHAGRNEFDEVAGTDYWDFGVSLSRSFGRVDTSLSYIATDLQPDSDDRLVASITANF